MGLLDIVLVSTLSLFSICVLFSLLSLDGLDDRDLDVERDLVERDLVERDLDEELDDEELDDEELDEELLDEREQFELPLLEVFLELINDLKLDNVSQPSRLFLSDDDDDPLLEVDEQDELRLFDDECLDEQDELRLFDDECLDEPLNLQRRPLEPRCPLLSYPLSSYHSKIFKTLFSLVVCVKSSRSLFLSSVSTVPITS